MNRETADKCIWQQQGSGIWYAECGIKVAWRLEVCPSCKREVAVMEAGKEEG